MRIANNLRASQHAVFGKDAALWVMLLGALSWMPSSAAWATTPAMPSMPSMPSMPALPSIPSADAAPAAPAATPVPPSPIMPASVPGAMSAAAAPAPMTVSPIESPALNLQNSNGSSVNKNASAMSDKITDDANGLVKHLDGSSDALTLQELNTARQTVARIDAMIEIEKRLNDLDKLRSERGGSSHSSATLANAVPASALAPLPLAPPPMPTAISQPVAAKPVEKEKPKSVANSLEVSRIIGAEGKYSAVLKLANGDLKPVRVGDTVVDHVTVRWISSSSVLVEENGETHTLRIKNVDAIFSAMR